MADSGYYWNLYWSKRKEVNSLTDDVKDIEKIRNRLYDDFDDDIRNIRREMNDLAADMKKAVRHNAVFSAQTDKVQEKEENEVGSDPKLSSAISELNEEISSLNAKKRQAESDRDYYHRMYEQKKEEERQELWNKITGQG